MSSIYTHNNVDGIEVPLGADEIAALEARDAAVNSLDNRRAKRKQALAQLRFEKEIAGVTMADGSIIRTDRESQALITGAWARAQQHPDVLIDWKSAAGWVQIDAPTVNAIADAVGTHVQACFSNERAHDAGIDAAADPDAYDITTGWPV